MPGFGCLALRFLRVIISFSRLVRLHANGLAMVHGSQLRGLRGGDMHSMRACWRQLYASICVLTFNGGETYSAQRASTIEPSALYSGEPGSMFMIIGSTTS